MANKGEIWILEERILKPTPKQLGHRKIQTDKEYRYSKDYQKEILHDLTQAFKERSKNITDIFQEENKITC